MKRKKKRKKFWIYVPGLFLLFLGFNTFVSSIHTSEIASFSASLGIVNGQVPYRDFLFSYMPLYHIIMSFFLYIFKTYQMVIIVNSAFAVVAFWTITKITRKGHLLFLAFLLLARPSSYLFIACLLLLIIRMELERKKYYQIRFDYWIGALSSCVLLTNLWLGILTSITLFQTSYNKKNRFLGWIIPIVCCFNYFLMTNSLLYFILHIKNQIPIFSFQIYTVFGIILIVLLGIERYRMRNFPNNKKILSIAIIMALSTILSPSATTIFLSLIFALIYFTLAYREEEYIFFINIAGYIYLLILFCFSIGMIISTTYSYSNSILGFQNTVLKDFERETLLAVRESSNDVQNVFVYSTSYSFLKNMQQQDNWYDLYTILLYYESDFQDEVLLRCQSESCIFIFDQEAPLMYSIEELKQVLAQSGYQSSPLFSFSVYKTEEKDFS